MKKIKLSANFAVFLLFFGAAFLETIRSQDWIKAGIWTAIGMIFLAADNLKKA